MDRPEQTTHFGFRDVPLGDKQTLVNEVFHSVASRYDLMNDLMSVGLHRVWKDIMINALNPPKSDAPFALLDVAGGTGDIAFRAAKAAGPGFRATVCDINTDMLEVGRSRAAARHLDDQVSFVEGNAEALAFPDRAFDAYTIAFGIRNVPRIDLALREAYRVLKPGSRFLCLEFSTVDVPGLDRIYDLFSFKVIPPLGRAVTGDAESYQYLVESIRKFPRPNAFAEMIRAAGFSRVKLAEPLRRHRGAAFGLAFVISATTHIARLVRAGFVFAREGVFGVVDPSLVPPPGQLALKLARLIERPGAKSGPRLSRALTRLGPAYLKLGQFLATRPDVVGVMMARDLESLQDRLPPFSQDEAEAVIATSLERPVAQAFASLGPAVAAASIAQVHRGEIERDGVRKAVAVKVLRPNVASRFRRDLADFFFVAHKAEAHSAEARRLRLIEVINTMSRSVAMEMDLRLEAAALSEMAENTRDDPDFRVPTVDWDRTTHNVLTMEWIDGIALNDHARLAAVAGRSARSRPQGDPEFSAPRAARRLLPRRHASRQSVPRRCRPAGRGRFRHHGPARPEGAALPRRNPARLHHPRLSPRRRSAFRGRLCAGPSFGGEFRAGHPRHRRADPQPHRRRNLDGEAADAAARGHRPVRHADPARTDPAAEDHGGGRGRGARLRSKARHLEGRRSRGARMDRAQSRPDRPDPGRDVRRRRPRPRADAACRRSPRARSPCWSSWRP